MSIKLHVKRGLEFRSDLYRTRDRQPWLAAVGKELEAKGVSVKVGQAASAIELKTADDLVKLYDEYSANPDAVAAKIGLPKGRELSEYLSDLVQALDDVVKDTSQITRGDRLDLTTQSALAKTLGLDDKSVRYASGRSAFGQTTARPDGTMSVLGVQLSRAEIAKDLLDGVPFIDASTFTGGRIQSGRNSTEIETVRRLNGLSGEDIVKLARTDRGGRTALRRMRKAKDAEAFSIGYAGMDYDEMRWDSRAHRIREAMPYTSLTIESGRFEVDDGEYEVSQGTDYFADTYYVGKDPSRPDADVLADNGILMRARIRYDEPGRVRRTLLQAKIASGMDADGNKIAAKADIRKDNPSADDIAALDEMVKTGKSRWGYGGADQPIEATQLVYQTLADQDALPDVGEHENVLILERGAHIFSQRSRYHLNETNPRDVKKLFDQGEVWLGELSALLEASPNAADLTALRQELGRLTDRTAILERAREDLAPLLNKAPADVTLDDINALWPRQITWGASPDKADARRRKVVADAISGAYHAFAEKIDDAQRAIGDSRNDMARSMRVDDEFMAFAKAEDPKLALKTTPGPFIAYLDTQLAGPNKDAFVRKLSAYLKDEHGEETLANASDPEAALRGLRQNLVSKQAEILHRQIEAAGTAATQLWFSELRDAYADIDPTTWNFLIDTFDFVMDIKPEDWDSLTDAQRNGSEEIPADKIYNADIISEVQIELGYEKPYTEALRKAKEALTSARAGVFMDYALAERAAEVTADDPASFVKLRDAALGGSDADRDGLLAALNRYAESKGSPLRFEADDLGALDADVLVKKNQGQNAAGHPALVDDFEVATFMRSTIIDSQEYIADLRGRRVTREARRAGFSGTEWGKTDMSKGEKALKLLRESRA